MTTLQDEGDTNDHTTPELAGMCCTGPAIDHLEKQTLLFIAV